MENRVALYCRLSKEDEEKTKGDDSESIQNQKLLLMDYARAQGWEIFKIYADDGYSGTNFNRPAFQRMIQDIKDNGVNMIITKDLSRLGRDYIETGYYLEKFFPENKIRYIALLDGIDTGLDNVNNDITPFKAVVNDLYSKDISKKIRGAFDTKMKEGLLIAPQAVYGYRKCPDNKNKLVVDEPASIIVKKIFHMALDGVTSRKIAEALNLDGVLSPTLHKKKYFNQRHQSIDNELAHLWKPETIRSMLTNRVYIGDMVQGRTKKVNYKSQKTLSVPKENWIIVEGTHEPIIDAQIFHKVQALLEKRISTRVKTFDYLLKGLLLCSECKKKLSVTSSRRKDGYAYFVRCTTNDRFSKLNVCSAHCMKLDTITEIVLSELRVISPLVLNEDTLKTLAQKELAKQKPNPKHRSEHSELVEALNALHRKIDMLYDDRQSGFINEDDFIRLYDSKQKEKQQLCDRIKTSEASDHANGADQADDRHDIHKMIADLINLEHPTKNVMTSLIDKVEITKEKNIIIFYTFHNRTNHDDGFRV